MNSSEIRAAIKRFASSQVVSYFVRAAIVVALLWIVAKVAPYLPSAVFPLVFSAYAVFSMIGALYFTVRNRIHKQHKLAATGNLSRLNRKWKWMMGGLLIASLASAFLFVLDSPKWDDAEWLLIVVAVPLYYIAYQLIQRLCKKEYAPKFYKAYTMRWSFWVVGILLCGAYAVVSAQSHAEVFGSLTEALQHAPRPYEHAFSATLSEVDKLSSFADGVASYAISQVTEDYFLIGLVWQFVIFASVIFGVLNQLRFCLLDWQEIKSEFQILPTEEEPESSGPILKAYIVVLVVVLGVAAALFLCTEFEMAKFRATEEYTAIDEAVDGYTDYLSFQFDGVVEEAVDRDKKSKEYEQEKSDLLDRRAEELTPLANEYYDRCMGNIDSYLDWYNGLFGIIAKQFKSWWRDDAEKTFRERIAAGVDATEIEESYNSYREQLIDLREENSDVLSTEEVSILLSLGPTGLADAENLDLWAVLDDSTVDGVLLCSEEELSEEDMKAKIAELIENARERTLSLINGHSA